MWMNIRLLRTNLTRVKYVRTKDVRIKQKMFESNKRCSDRTKDVRIEQKMFGSNKRCSNRTKDVRIEQKMFEQKWGESFLFGFHVSATSAFSWNRLLLFAGERASVFQISVPFCINSCPSVHCYVMTFQDFLSSYFLPFQGAIPCNNTHLGFRYSWTQADGMTTGDQIQIQEKMRGVQNFLFQICARQRLFHNQGDQMSL
jgi:hypothetical protein